MGVGPLQQPLPSAINPGNVSTPIPDPSPLQGEGSYEGTNLNATPSLQ